MEPLVSFVVPCYNYAHLLPQCIHSILGQTYKEFEILIMDNCSPDNTPEVAASFNDPRVKHIRNEVNLGHVRNFNKGITMAQGKYVWLISPDDWLRSPDVLQRYVELMEKNPGVGYVFCRSLEVRGSQQPKEIGIAQWTSCGPEDRIWEGPNFVLRLLQNNCVVLSAAMVRKECYDKLGLFSLEMPHANDVYLFFVLALHYQVAYMAEPMVFVRIHETSLTSEFDQTGSAFCVIDELTVLWRVARLAEQAGMVKERRAFNTCIANLAAQSLKYGSPGRPRPRLNEADLETLVHQYVKDANDEADFHARLHMAIGDQEFWHAEYKKAAQAYWSGLRLRPWWLRIWVKYLLLRTGALGLCIRRFMLGQRQSRAEVA